MSASIRATILETARIKFNEAGYDHVTMRDIAESCGIAVGNLTYHFHRKQDLVEAIMEDAFIIAKPSEGIRRLSDVTEQFSRMLDTLQRYAFFFLDDLFIEDHREHNQAIRQRLLEGLNTLTLAGFFKDSFDEETRAALLNMLLLTHVSWLRVVSRTSTALSKAELLRGHWLVLRPYLTDKGLEEYNSIKKEPPLT